jgi:hypothetical protein
VFVLSDNRKVGNISDIVVVLKIVVCKAHC